MELDAITQARWIVAAVVAVFAAWWIGTSAANRRHKERFAALASDLGATMTAETEHRWTFPLEAAGRTFRVERTHRGGGAGSSSVGPGWLLITSTPLAGVRSTHSASIRPRWTKSLPTDARDAGFADHFVIHDLGYPLPEGWLDDRVRTALLHFFRQELPPGTLDLEGARLSYLLGIDLAKLTPAALRELLERQAAVAGALERAL